MKKYVFLVVAGLMVSACDKKSTDGVISRQCGDYMVEMSFNASGDKMHAVINGDTADLDIAVSASGARYVGIMNDTDVTLWGRGDDWVMFIGDEDLIECIVK